MKHWYLALLLALCGLSAFGQHTNDWIDYNQQYLKIPITEDGVYRIYYSPLNQAMGQMGVSLDNVDPRSIQIYGRGREQAIHVEGENDGTFNQTDFIEFYAQANDGWLDTALYLNEGDQPNPYYSLFTDTAYYFLTWSPGNTSNLRAGQQNNTNLGQAQALPYFLKEEVVEYHQVHYEGEKDAYGKSNPDYSHGEGWLSGHFELNQFSSVNIPTPFPYTSGPAATGRILFVGVNNPSVSLDHAIVLQFANQPNLFTPIDTFIFDGYKQYNTTFSIAPGNVGQSGNNNSTIRLLNDTSLLNAVPPTSRTAIGFASVTYAREPNFGGGNTFAFDVPSTGSAYSRIDAVNYTSATTSYAWDLTARERITIAGQSGSTIQFLVSGGDQKRIHVQSDNSIASITTLEPAGNNGSFYDFSNDFEEDLFVIISHPSVWNGAQAYRDYRLSTDHNVMLADVEDLYDQYAYGVRKHPSAIRAFARWMLDESFYEPQHLFLIGKSVNNKCIRTSESCYSDNVVPTWGFPGSDIYFTALMHGRLLEPAIPTGRLAATNNQEVEMYLNKVEEWEEEQEFSMQGQTIENRDWMKRIIHFGGGSYISEQNAFKNYLAAYRDTIANPKFGGWVYSFFKNTTDPIQQNVTDSVTDLINSGVSLMTFFGHASGSSFDISIGLPDDYNNTEGKYPLVLANSCNAGDIHTPISGTFRSTSEAFVLHPRGAIGFISSTSLGYRTRLNNYTTAWYSNVANTNYGGTVGRSMANAVAAIQGDGTNNLTRGTCLEMCLHGDPAIKMPSFPLPDYATEEALVYLEPETPSTDLSEFSIFVQVHNLGRATLDSVELEVHHIFPDGSDTLFTLRNKPIFYKDTIEVVIPIDVARSAGLNRFEFFIDPLNFVDELSESNNNIQIPGIEVWISSQDLIPVSPYDFAIVPDLDMVLRASTADPMSETRNYILQIDTTDTYDSPSMLETTVNAPAGVVEWNPTSWLSGWPSGTVFFWRASPEPNTDNPNTYSWRERSFQYLQGESGWGQDHFFQFKNNDYLYINHNRNSRDFEFIPIVRNLTCQVLGSPLTSNDNDFLSYLIDGVVQEDRICSTVPTLLIAVIDSLTLKPWGTRKELDGVLYNPNHGFGNANDLDGCRDYRVERYFRYLIDSPPQMDAMADLIANQVPDGNYVLMYCATNGLFQDSTKWEEHMFQAYEALGASEIRNIADTVPYIFFAKKGHPNTAEELWGSTSRDTLILNTTIQSNFWYGEQGTPAIGPALNWNSLHWSNYALENNSNDTITVSLIGVRPNQARDTLAKFTPQLQHIYNLDTLVNASQYPYVELAATTRDDTTQTPSQLGYWRVLYDLAPEAALDPSSGFTSSNDTVPQGQDFTLSMPIRNVGEVDMDSLRVRYWVEDRFNREFEVNYPKQDSLRVGDLLIDAVSAPTNKLEGFNAFWIDVNPEDSLWQPEQYHFNNVARIPFYVEPDQANPLLDVTFDGIHILDGDIVSPTPEIVITVDDENQFLALEDTADVQVFLVNPAGTQHRVYFTDGNGVEQLRFTPGSLPKNESRIEFAPELDQDGVYKLVVYAEDMSGNAAGVNDFEISFEVIHESTITQVLNYPNPFSTSTRFVFTLTGSQVPDLFRIQILTVTGKVVREITEAEIGPINIGRNVSQYAWDGTDEYGDRLANGVYLYRVITKIDGETIDQRESKADQFFHKGFGKMYLMR